MESNKYVKDELIAGGVSETVEINGKKYEKFKIIKKQTGFYVFNPPSVGIYVDNGNGSLKMAEHNLVMGTGTCYTLDENIEYYVESMYFDSLRYERRIPHEISSTESTTTTKPNNTGDTYTFELKETKKSVKDELVEGEAVTVYSNGTNGRREWKRFQIKEEKDGEYVIFYPNPYVPSLWVQDTSGRLVSADSITVVGLEGRSGYGAACYKLDKDTEYFVDATFFDELEYVSGTPELFYSRRLSSLETMLSSFVRTAANGILGLINWAIGGEGGVTIDKIIFNEYKPTQLVYFDKAARESAGHEVVGSIANAINTWFNIFRAIAITGYIALLLYMGIQVLLKSTGEKQAQYKKLLVDWVIGIGILFMFPYVIKYCINLNNIFVKMINDSKVAIGITYKDPEYVKKDFFAIHGEATDSEIQAFTDLFDNAEFEEAGNNYMVLMKNKADNTKRLVYAIVYMIIVWQLLMLVIAYYKRTFMVGFLLVLFPLVALSYAIDKIADGKSQAFNTWGKEIIINIFIQTFHAIIYVISMSAVMVSSDGEDWILMIIGVSFLFKGEEIIKSIFGQKGDSVESLAATAGKAFVTYKAVTSGAKAIKDNVVGKDSHLKKAIDHSRNANMYERQARNFDMFATQPPNYTMPPAAALPHAPAVMDDEATQLGNDIQTINHRDVADPVELAMAIERTQEYYNNPNAKHADMLNDLNVSKEQLDGLKNIREGAIRQAASGVDDLTIEQNIKIELETLMKGEDTRMLEQALYRQMALPYRTNHLGRNTYMPYVENELMAAKRRKQEIENFEFNYAGDGDLDDLKDNASNLIISITGSSRATAADMQMATYIEMIKDRASAKYSARQYSTAAKYIREHINDAEEYKKMVDSIGYDFDEVRHAIAHKTVNQYCDNSGNVKAEYASDAGIVDACAYSAEVKDDIENREDRIQDLFENLRFGTENLDEKEDELFAEGVNDLLEETYGARNYTKEEREFASHMYKLKDRNMGNFTRDSIIDSYNYVAEHANDNMSTAMMLEKLTMDEKCDMDELGHALQHHVSDAWYSDEDLNEISVSTLIRNEESAKARGIDYSTDGEKMETDLVADIIKKREAQNSREADMARRFAERVMTEESVVEPTINGMTREDLLEMAQAEREQGTEEYFKAAITTSAGLGAMPIGAAAGIAFIEDDDGNPFSEGIVGAMSAAGLADELAERTLGKSSKTRNIVLYNPFIGEDQEVTIRLGGAFSERIYSYDDPSLPSDVSASIRAQFLDAKVKKQRAEAAERQRRIDNQS